MPNAARVLALPNMVELPNRTQWVRGFTLQLTYLGAGQTIITEEAAPAELTFSARFLSSARPGPQPPFEDFALLTGHAHLTGANRTPVFVRDPQADFKYFTPSPEPTVFVRELEVKYHSSTFPGGAPVGSPATKLRLPQPPEDARYLEVGFTLRIGGAVEAEASQCDILDVTLSPRPRKLRLRFPKDKDTLPATFVLKRENDGVEQRRSHCDDLIPNDEFLDIEFDEIIDGFAYSLRMEYAGRKARPIFTRKTYAALVAGAR
jgi:hypothetical protein